MKKCIFICLVLLSVNELSAETLLQIYPPSLIQYVSGKRAMYNTFRKDSLDEISEATFSESEYTMFNLPIEIRQTVVEFSTVDSMVAGGLSFYFENNALSSINLSTGLTIGYGYNRNKDYFSLRLNITIYPLYEFPLNIFWRTPKFPWKFALDTNIELLQIGPVSINAYLRLICSPTSEAGSGIMYYPDIGLTAGWLFKNIIN
ncbi:MAG: hypothetical protein LBU88_05190 [Treponema sp.]|jgi:hypothetical protein|nr:hypothetical protein [Treponema sp.]